MKKRLLHKQKCNEMENKLKEFNYKVINGILSCNFNLKWWQKAVSDSWYVCEEQQTIRHLIFDCKYVKPLWSIIETKLGRDISYVDIICGIHENEKSFLNHLITLVSYLIYKEWMLASLKNNKRNQVMWHQIF